MFLFQRFFIFVLILVLSSVAVGCSSSSTTDDNNAVDDADNDGGDDNANNDDAEVDTSTLASRLESGTSALLPDMSSSEEEANITPLIAKKAITYQSDANWGSYTSEENLVYLEDIFGNDLEGPVTQVRVLISQFTSSLSQLMEADPSLDCTGTTALTDADSITLPFYGAISNGSAGDRHFDCFFQSNRELYVYGSDSSGIIYVASMSAQESENIEQVEDRGDTQTLMQVVMVTYAPTTEEETEVTYLDLQYNQASLYNGPDDTFDTDDDNEFKSRSRIIGRITFDSEGNPVESSGDFSVIKYDRSPTPEGDPQTMTTQVLGRGSYGAGDYSLFSIDSSFLEGLEGVFCLQVPEADSTIPESTTTTNCTTLETNYAWGSSTFPFTLSPSLGQTFEDLIYFEGDDTDLIASDGSNFTIPTYE